MSRREVRGRPARPLPPTGAEPSGGLRGSCPGLVISPPHIPFQGPTNRPKGPSCTDRQCRARADRPAGRGPRSLTACPAGPARSPGARSVGHRSKDLVAGGFGLQLVRRGQCDQAAAADRPRTVYRLHLGRTIAGSTLASPVAVRAQPQGITLDGRLLGRMQTLLGSNA